MIALIELRPIGVAQTIEGGERLSVLPAACCTQARARIEVEIGDRSLARRGEMLVCLLVSPCLKASQPSRNCAMRCDGSTLTSSRASLMALVPIGGSGLEQESLLEDQLVLGILGERPAHRSPLRRRYRGRRGQRARRDNCRAACRARRSRLRSRPPPNRPLARRRWPRQRETFHAPSAEDGMFRHLACAIRLGAAPILQSDEPPPKGLCVFLLVRNPKAIECLERRRVCDLAAASSARELP